MKLRTALAGLLGTFIAATGASSAQAQNYPEREIKLLVGFAPGGTTNTLARILADRLSDVLGQRVIVENRPGVNGAIATRAAARAPADGYTLVFNASNMALNLHGMKEPGYRWDDFTVLSGFAYGTLILVTNTASSKAKTFQEFVDFGKANPEKLKFASLGPQSIQNVAAERVNDLTRISWRQVPYKGVDQVIPDLINGNVDAYFSLPITITQIANQPNITVFATTDKRRLELFPNVPTFTELGFAPVNDYVLSGIWAPAGTPKPVVDKLRAAMAEVMKKKETKTQIDGTGYLLYDGSAEQFDADIRKQADQYANDFKKLGIQPE